jgi:hypothetical protein
LESRGIGEEATTLPPVSAEIREEPAHAGAHKGLDLITRRRNMARVQANSGEAARGDVPADDVLLKRFTAQREQAAFAALVQRHGPMVLGVCRRVL